MPAQLGIDWGRWQKLLSKKATTTMTNCTAMAITLNGSCSGEHEHQQLTGGKRTVKAQEYLPQLCKTLIDGMALQMQWDTTSRFLVATIEKEILNFNKDDPEQAARPREGGRPN